MDHLEPFPWRRIDTTQESITVGIDVRDGLRRPYLLFAPFPAEVIPSVFFLEVRLHTKVLEGMNVCSVQ